MREIEKDEDGVEHIVVARLVGKVDTENRIKLEANGSPKDVFKILIDLLHMILTQTKVPPAMSFFAQGLMAATADLVVQAEAFQKSLSGHHPENEGEHEEIDLSWMYDALKNVKPEKPADPKQPDSSNAPNPYGRYERSAPCHPPRR